MPKPVVSTSAVLLMLSLLAAAAICSTQVQSVQVVDTDLCALSSHPKEFDKKRVRVQAEIIRGMHGSALVDNERKCGVTLWYARATDNDPNFKALDSMVLHERSLGAAGKPIMGVFTGQFLQHGKDTFTRKKRMVLVADQVEDVVVSDVKP